MTLWDRLLHALWRRVGEPGMPCSGLHVEPGDRITVRIVDSSGWADRAVVVNSVTCRESEHGERVTGIVLREES